MKQQIGFVYIWFDRKHKRYYVGSHWGHENDGYICSSKWMKRAYQRRPSDFKRRIIQWVGSNKKDLLVEEQRWLDMIKPEELSPRKGIAGQKGIVVRYYNISLKATGWHENMKNREIKPFSEERKKAISEGKKVAFEKRRSETGQSYSDETRESWKGKTRRPQSLESNAKRSKALKLAYAEGRKVAGGKPQSEESNRKRSLTQKGRPGKPHSEETRSKLAYDWLVTSPSGQEHRVRNLKRFCQENGLTNTNIAKPSGSKGWKARKL